MLSRSPKYQPLKQTSDSPEPESIANPQVQLPSPDSQTTSQNFYPIACTIPPLHPKAQTLKQTPDSPGTSAVQVTTSLGRSSVRMRCPNCRTEQITETEYKLGNTSWVCCILLSVLIGLFGLFALCMPCLMDVEHSCPNCDHMLGTFQP